MTTSIITIPKHDDALAMLAQFPIGTEVQVSENEAIRISGVTVTEDCDRCGAPAKSPVFFVSLWNELMSKRFGHEVFDGSWHFCLSCTRGIFSSDDPRAATSPAGMFE